MKETLTWLTSYREARFVSSPFMTSVIHILKLRFNIEPNLVMRHLSYTVRHSVVPTTCPLLTIMLH